MHTRRHFNSIDRHLLVFLLNLQDILDKLTKIYCLRPFICRVCIYFVIESVCNMFFYSDVISKLKTNLFPQHLSYIYDIQATAVQCSARFSISV